MLVLNRFLISPETADSPEVADSREVADSPEVAGSPGVSAAEDSFVERAHAALTALAAQTGYVSGRLARALDDPAHWSLVTEWESVGAYRRALGAFEVKVNAVPLLSQSIDEPSAYETLASAAPGGQVEVAASDRAAEQWR